MGEIASVIRAFSGDHAVRLTGLSMRQLRYWDDTGFFRPRYAAENRRSPYGRVYSFRDIVGLRTLSVLRKRYEVPLQHLRKTAKELVDLGENLWSKTTLYVLDREVYFREPETGAVRKAIGGQYVVDVLPLSKIITDVSAESEKLRQRTPEQMGQVARHRYIAHNAWVIAGTRIPTGTIRRYIEAGYSVADVIREYPSLTETDVRAALAHEAELTGKRKFAKSA